MTKSYDAVVIGGGTAAMVAAMSTRAGGKAVALIDFPPLEVLALYGGVTQRKCSLADPCR